MSFGTVAVEPGARRGGAAWFLLIALGCGLLAATLAVRAVSAARREVPVVVALRTVSPLSAVAAADVRLTEVPQAAVPAGAYRRTSAVLGQFARLGLAPGEIVTPASLDGGLAGDSATDARLASLAGACPAAPGAPQGSGSAGPAAPGGPAEPACQDLVASAVPLDADQGFDIVAPGDRVDIAATYDLDLGAVAQVVVADAPVLEKIAGSASGTVAGGSAAGGSGWLILALSPADALRVQLAESAGKVAVLLRPLGAPAEAPALTQEVVGLTQLAGAAATPASSVQPAPAAGGTLPPQDGASGNP